jgi:hypothetical protein
MDRFTLGVVVGAVLLVIAAVVSVVLLQGQSAAPDLSTPEGVVRAYYAALDQGHPEQAWDLLSSRARAQTTRDEFIQRAISFRPGREQRVTIDSVEIVGDTANVNLSLTSSGGGLLGGGSYSQTVRVRLDREDGQWRITVPPQPYLIDSPRQAPAPPATPIPSPSPGPTPRPAT